MKDQLYLDIHSLVPLGLGFVVAWLAKTVIKAWRARSVFVELCKQDQVSTLGYHIFTTQAE